MEIDVVKWVSKWEEMQLIESKFVAKEMVCDESIIFEEELVNLHHAKYDESK